MNGLSILWVNKAMYLRLHFICNSHKTDFVACDSKVYSQFNNVLSMSGKGSYEMND